MKSGGRFLATAIVAAGLCAPGTANAAVSATVTGDDGNPAALTPGVPLPIRNMDLKAVGHVDAADGKAFIVKVVGPDGVAATTDSSCLDTRYSNETTRYVDYRGNGTYTLTVSLFTDTACKTGQKDVAYAWTVNAGVAISPPAPTMLIRAANSFTTITQLFNFAGNPGAISYDIKYAKGATVLPDGSLSSPALKDGFVDSATGKVQLIGAREPGTYTIVARARNGDYYTPWTAPVNFNLIAPFDLSSRSFPDPRGPSYQVRAVVGEPSAAGSRVTVAVAKGKNGRHFRTLGKPKVNSKGAITLRFRLKLGTYRMRYSFKGSSTVARGTVYDVVRIKRVLG
ncbi:MAG TPA: hypothetical protein VI300_25530 [Solirubrobacter sp.]